MGHKKSTTTTKSYLESAPLPQHAKTYTVVSHKEVMDLTETLLNKQGFTITTELYKTNINAKVAQGIYHITHDTAVNDPEMGMMFAWTNSYDKSTRFQCGIGAHVFVCNNGLIHGDLATYGRKHTGTANADISSHIVSQIGMANHKFNELVKDKIDMKNFSLSRKQQAELLGRLFADEKILDTQQLSCVKAEMDDVSYNYNVDPNTAWVFYNHVTHALKLTHPRNWMDSQSKFHTFMSSEIYNAVGIKPQDTPIVIDDDNYDLDAKRIPKQTLDTDDLDYNKPLEENIDEIAEVNSIIEVDEDANDTFTL